MASTNCSIIYSSLSRVDLWSYFRGSSFHASSSLFLNWLTSFAPTTYSESSFHIFAVRWKKKLDCGPVTPSLICGVWSWNLCCLLGRCRGMKDGANVDLSYWWKCLNISIMSPLFRLNTSVGKSRRFNLSGYSRLDSPSTSFVDRTCTFSNVGGPGCFSIFKMRPNECDIDSLEGVTVQIRKAPSHLPYDCICGPYLLGDMLLKVEIGVNSYSQVLFIEYVLHLFIVHSVTMSILNVFKLSHCQDMTFWVVEVKLPDLGPFL